MQECVPLFKKRGRIVILSDFLDDTAALFDALAQFVHRKFEILLLQIADPDELNLPAFNAAKFVDLETAETVQVDPEEIRAAYQAHMQQIDRRSRPRSRPAADPAPPDRHAAALSRRDRGVSGISREE